MLEINDTDGLTASEIKELLISYGYSMRSENNFLKEFNECQIIIRYLGDVLEFKVKSTLAFPTKTNDSIQLTVSSLGPEKLDLAGLESFLLTMFQQVQEVQDFLNPVTITYKGQ